MALPNVSKEKKEMELSGILKEYTCVFASTLNQMINYIPIKMFSFKELYSVTLCNDANLTKKVEDNEEWDRHLSGLISDINEIKIYQNEYLNVSKTIGQFRKELEGKKVFWNLTGGQRPFVLAVLEYVKNRPDDYVAYLEGNTGKLTLRINNVERDLGYQLPKEANLETALKLMGYKPQSTFNSNVTIDTNEQNFWADTFYKQYIGSKDFRKNLVLLNKKKDEKDQTIDKNKCWEEIFNILGLTDKSYLDAYKNSKAEYPFGYILEKMVFYVLYKNFHTKVQQIYASLRSYADGSQIDEFDIIILTKTGKVINFECKSGVMDGDVAKSTKYSTYAISGVYGLPILITPLLKQYKKEFPFENSCDAISAADRANLKVWFIDEIKTKLEDLLK